MPKPPAVDPDDVRDWLAEHPEATLEELKAAFPRLPDTTARRWLADGPPVPLPPLGPVPSKAPVPVADLPESARLELVETIRNLRRGMLAWSRTVVDEKSGRPRIDRDDAQAWLAAAKTIRELQAAHPGLEELTRKGGGDDGDDDALARAARALERRL